MDQTRVVVWFQNRRAKAKKQQTSVKHRASESPVSSHVSKSEEGSEDDELE